MINHLREPWDWRRNRKIRHAPYPE